jgi:hypothetical protein
VAAALLGTFPPLQAGAGTATAGNPTLQVSQKHPMPLSGAALGAAMTAAEGTCMAPMQHQVLAPLAEAMEGGLVVIAAGSSPIELAPRHQLPAAAAPGVQGSHRDSNGPAVAVAAGMGSGHPQVRAQLTVVGWGQGLAVAAGQAAGRALVC